MWVMTKQINMHITQYWNTETKKGAESIFEKIMAMQFPKLTKHMNIHVQEAMNSKQDKLRGPTKRSTVIIKVLKTKYKENLKSRKRGVTGQIKGIRKNISQWNEGQKHNRMKVEISNKSNTGKFTNVQKLIIYS